MGLIFSAKLAGLLMCAEIQHINLKVVVILPASALSSDAELERWCWEVTLARRRLLTAAASCSVARSAALRASAPWTSRPRVQDRRCGHADPERVEREGMRGGQQV
eukprot:2724333-Rhodomonas_salina.1